MAVEMPTGDDSELNMTPMIDIVFQLIVFFLLTLKFKSIDRRIDSQLPKDRGLAPTTSKPSEFEKIKVKLFRKELGTANAFTRIRVGNNKKNTWNLPAGEWPDNASEVEARRKKYDEVFASIAKLCNKLFEAQGRHEDVTGEIAAMPPTGRAVPHGDIARVLDMMVEIGLKKVVFEGAPPPVLSKDGGFMTGHKKN